MAKYLHVAFGFVIEPCSLVLFTGLRLVFSNWPSKQICQLTVFQQGAHKRILDIASTLGLSNTVMRLIDKRATQVLLFVGANEGLGADCAFAVSAHIHRNVCKWP